MRIFRKPITTSPIKRHGPAVLAFALAMLMLVSALKTGTPSKAADLVCGDGDKEGTEQCDDGNLKNGDGCSSTCTLELCGNATIDLNEQCDDGNQNNNDGCNRYCQIEFCGDSVVQSPRGEQCDDGNGISGDGCSGVCTLENQTAPVLVVPVVQQQPAPQTSLTSLMISALQAQKFLNSDDGADFKAFLGSDDNVHLEIIIDTLVHGRHLTKEQRGWAVELYLRLQDAQVAYRALYTDLLKQFISTPISSDVVEEKDLQKWRLVDVYVPMAIDELKKSVGIIRRGEIKQQVTVDITKLQRQGIDLGNTVPENYEANLQSGVQPIKVFATLKTLKEATERYATQNLPQSLAILRDEASQLKQALPIFQREYGLQPDETEPLLTAIEDLSYVVTKQDTDRIVGAVNRFLGVLDRRQIFTQADVASLGIETAHAAAAADRIVKTYGAEDTVQTPAQLTLFLDELANGVPAGERAAYATGTVEEQRGILLTVLETDKRLKSLRDILHKEGRTDFDQRYQSLHEAILRVGTGEVTSIGCDDSMEDALRCTNEYLNDVQAAVRDRSLFTKIIGTLQDLFGM